MKGVTLDVHFRSYTEATRRGARMVGRLIAAVLLLQVGVSGGLYAQSFEQRLLAIPDTASVRQMSRDLSAVPHMAGTPAQATTRDYVLDKMKSWGIDAWSKEYTVYIPQPDTVAAWIFPGPRRSPVRLNLAEPGTGGARRSRHSTATPATATSRPTSCT